MAPGKEVPATKPEVLNSIPRPHRLEGENRLLRVLLWLAHMCSDRVPINTHQTKSEIFFLILYANINALTSGFLLGALRSVPLVTALLISFQGERGREGLVLVNLLCS